jgi:hypothetical protein
MLSLSQTTRGYAGIDNWSHLFLWGGDGGANLDLISCNPA